MPTSPRSLKDLAVLKAHLMLSRDTAIKNTSTFGRVRIVTNFPGESSLFYLADARLAADDLLAAVWTVIKDPQDTVCRYQGKIADPESDAPKTSTPE